MDTASSNSDSLLELQDRLNRAWMDRQHYKAYVRPIIEPEKEQGPMPIDELTEELDSLAEYTALLILEEDGTPLNTAFRIHDLKGALTWAMSGKGEPFSSATLALGIIRGECTYKILGGAK